MFLLHIYLQSFFMYIVLAKYIQNQVSYSPIVVLFVSTVITVYWLNLW